MEEKTQIGEFFENQTTFITGGTGLVGKLIIEKLLRSCNVKKIYILIRPQKTKTSQERFDQLLNNACFERVKNPLFKKKLCLIEGDCEKTCLGINPKDVTLLKEETTCIYHVASNVQFDQTLKQASLNLRATRDLVQMAKEMPNLKFFVYVSTVYSNCVYQQVKEEIYRPPLKAETFLGLVESLEDKTVENITVPLLGKWPNAYVYMKCISEDLIKRSELQVPIAVVRPSAIISTINEPIKGWIDNAYAFIGVVLGSYVGIIRSYNTGKKNNLFVVPADYVSNCILAASWNTVRENSIKPIVYNCVGESKNLGELEDLLHKYYWHFPSVKYMWYKSFKLRENRFWHQLSIYRDLLPACFMDILSVILGIPIGLAKKFRYINSKLKTNYYFAQHDWKFDEENVKELWNRMSENDKKNFKFNSKISDWDTYFSNCALGVRLYLLKDPISTLPAGKKKLWVLCVLHYAIIVFFLCFLCVLMFKLFVN